MRWLQEFLIRRAEKRLSGDRKKAETYRKRVEREYVQYLPLIRACYQKARYWHGTGRYHYYLSTDARYAGLSSDAQTDTLDSILQKGELRAHQDLWVSPEGENRKTLSIAPSRMHSRFFADIHQNESENVAYELGSPEFWLHLLLLLLALELIRKLPSIHSRYVRQLCQFGSIRKFRTFLRSIRAKEANANLWKAYQWRSDIEGNHGMLFGILDDNFGDGTFPFIARLELRIPGSVSLKKCTHVEVPLAHVADVTELLQNNGVELPVIPIEFGELYVSQRPLRDLVFVK